MYKFGSLPDGENDVEFQWPNIWLRETTTGPPRLAIAPRSNQVDLLKKLAESMQEPFNLLYVFVVPRSDSAPGRYQSKIELNLTQLKELLDSFQLFLERDGRHNLWIRSVADGSFLVYDRHNVIYAYGALEGFVSVLAKEGLTEETAIHFPVPHSHHYNKEFDSEEERMLNYLPWAVSPLRKGDTNPGE